MPARATESLNRARSPRRAERDDRLNALTVGQLTQASDQVVRAALLEEVAADAGGQSLGDIRHAQMIAGHPPMIGTSALPNGQVASRQVVDTVRVVSKVAERVSQEAPVLGWPSCTPSRWLTAAAPSRATSLGGAVVSLKLPILANRTIAPQASVDDSA
jgi:hypothetical protein